MKVFPKLQKDQSCEIVLISSTVGISFFSYYPKKWVLFCGARHLLI